jgi:hypothetical protein
MTGKIKYGFHELRNKNPNKYTRELYKVNLDYKQKKIIRSLNSYYNNKTWMVRNCITCGRFCSKYSSKYCKDCAVIFHIIDSRIGACEQRRRQK